MSLRACGRAGMRARARAGVRAGGVIPRLTGDAISRSVSCLRRLLTRFITRTYELVVGYIYGGWHPWLKV